MKLLYIECTGHGDMRVEAGSDSAVLRQGEPVFVPDPVEDWRSVIAPAVRIHRLGTAIKSANAHAYYDAVAPVHLLLPADCNVAQGLPPLVLDRALSPGDWQPVAGEDHEYFLGAGRGPIGRGSPLLTLSTTFTKASLAIDSIIERLSRLMTLRTGDILVFGAARLEIGAPVLDTVTEAFLDGECRLSIRIK